MNSKKNIPPICLESTGESIEMTIDLFDNIYNVLCIDLGYNHTEIYNKTGFNNKTLGDLVAKRNHGSLKVKPAIKEFISAGYTYLLTHQKPHHPFIDRDKLFKRKVEQPNKIFIDGLYYGFFQKEDGRIYHFILIVEGNRITVTSELNTTTGLLEDNPDTYFSQLFNKDKTVTNFLIGLKIPNNPKEKTFIATWYSDKNGHSEISSALCKAVFIPEPKYKTIEEIEEKRNEGRRNNKTYIHDEIISKIPHDLEEFFAKEKHKYICRTKNL